MKKTITILMTICMLLTSITFGQLSVSAKVAVPKSKIKSVSIIDTTTLKIKWKKVKSIKKYELYYKVSGGKYKKLATLGKNKTSYTHKKLISNKKYFYKVRTCKYVNGKKYCSKLSSQAGKSTTNYLMLLTKPYETNIYSEYVNGNSMVMGGDNYTNGFVLKEWLGYAPNAKFNLKGKYNKISFTCGTIDGVAKDQNLYILSDDICVKTIEIKGGDLPKNYTIEIGNATKLEFKGDGGRGAIGLANIKVYK